MTQVGPIERRMISEVAAEPVNERDWVRIFVGDPPFVEAVHASCTPAIVILGCGVRIPDQRQVVTYMGSLWDSTLHLFCMVATSVVVIVRVLVSCSRA